MKTSKMCIIILALSLGIAGPGSADEIEFIRFKKGSEVNSGALQIAQASYKNPKTKVEIILYGVVHIADKDYYKAIQKDLDSYTAVLWEGIKPGKKKVKPGGMTINVGEIQKLMCDILGLTFQKDGINYKRDNFVWADMTMDQLQKALGNEPSQTPSPAPEQSPGMINPKMLKQLKPILEMGRPFIKLIFESFPEFQKTIKVQFAQQLASTGKGGPMPGMNKKFMQVILIERNKLVMEFLKKQFLVTKKGTIAIFYGAAHMPDFHSRLGKIGYKQVKKEWKSAWKIGSGTKSEKEYISKPQESLVPVKR